MTSAPAPRHRGVLFPVLLIAAGALILAINFGLVRSDIWLDLLTLWPVLLIGAGLSVMFGRSRMGAVFAAGVTLALLVGGALWLQRTTAARTPQRSVRISAPAAGAKTADIRLAPGAAAVTVGALPAGSAELISGTAGAGRGRILEPSFKLDGTTGRFELAERQPAVLGFGDVRGRSWDLDVARDLPLTLAVNAGVGRLALDLSDVTLTSLDLDLGVGEVVTTLPAEGRMDVTINGGVGALTLRLPRGLEARVDADAGIGAVDIPDGFDKVDDGVWETADYGASSDRADITIDGGVGAVNVEWVTTD